MKAGSNHGHGGHPATGATGAWAKENMTKASDWRWTILPESLHTTNIVKTLVESTVTGILMGIYWLIMVNKWWLWLTILGILTIRGWWFTYPSEKYEFVCWDYSSQYMENNNCSTPPTRKTSTQFIIT